MISRNEATVALIDQAESAASGAPRVLPRATTLVRAFMVTPAEHPVLRAAAGLGAQHRLLAGARRLTCDPDAGDRVVADATRSVNAAEAGCAVLVDRIDMWFANHHTEARAGVVHTETVGQLVDRLAWAWAHWHMLNCESGAGSREQARLAFQQLGELSNAYDDLITDLATGRRRLPIHQTATCPRPAA